MAIQRGILILFFLWVGYTKATIQPANGAVLNYTQVMFEFDEQEGADSYTLSLYRPRGIGKQTIKVQSLACLVKKGLSFGETYKWFYTATRNGKVIFTSDEFSFGIAADFLVDTSKFRYNIMQQQAGAYQDNLVFIDYLGVAINRSGRPVWYMPRDSSQYFAAPVYRNMQQTSTGTYTFLKGDKCYEKDRQGNILWVAPEEGSLQGNATAQYHHDFGKLADGSYMACSYLYADEPCLYDSTVNCRIRYNTVMQYSNTGKLLWYWNEKDYMQTKDLFALTEPGVTDIAGTHMNGFSFNKKNNMAVFSFRNNSTLLWVNTKTGKIVHRLRGDDGSHKSIQFVGQHSPELLANGDLLVYNNNSMAGAKAAGDIIYPRILVLSAPVAGKPVQKKWEYECRMNEYPQGWQGKEGYAGMLPNGNVLVCVGGANKMLEITKDKKVVWEMNCSMYSDEKGSWTPFGNYRSHFASSLYPGYITVQKITGSSMVKPGQVLRIKINNDGTEGDMYKVEMFSGGNFEAYNSIITVAAGKSKLQNIMLKKVPGKAVDAQSGSFLLVRISSLLHPGLIKTIDYRIAQ
jgi:hypothetical protein